MRAPFEGPRNIPETRSVVTNHRTAVFSFAPMAIIAIVLASTPRRASAQAPGFVRSWPTTEAPMAIVIRPDGSLLVGAQQGSSALVHVYAQNGSPLPPIGIGGANEVEGIGLLSNQAIVVLRYTDTFGYVFNGTGNLDRVVQYDGSRRRYVAVAPQDVVYSSDDVDGVIRRCSVRGNGAILSQWPSPQPSGICYVDGVIYAAGMTNGLISVYALNGGFIRSFASGCANAQQLATDGIGDLLVADHGAHVLRCFRTDGSPLWTIGPTVPGYANGTCDFQSVGVDPGGTIFAGDFTHRAILVFSQQATGTRPSSWGRVKRLFATMAAR